MGTELDSLSIFALSDRLRSGEVSAKDVAASCFEKIKNDDTNSFVCLDEERAMRSAEKADRILANARKSKEQVSRFMGIPVGIKSLFMVNGLPSDACSDVLSGFKSPYDAHVVKKLRDNGATVMGLLNMDEFAMGSANCYGNKGRAINPYVRSDGVRVVPGGSSGGSAAAVAANLCSATLGSDTGGSVRQPAAFCGVVGIKPTYGRCSRFGMLSFANSLDQAGVFAANVKDAALSLEVISGWDSKDSTSLNIETPKFSEILSDDMKGKKIAVLDNIFDDEKDEITEMFFHSLKILEDAGAEILHFSLPEWELALPIYYIVCSSEAYSNLSRYTGVRYGKTVTSSSFEESYSAARNEFMGEEVKRRLVFGAAALHHHDGVYMKAQKARALLTGKIDEIFEKVDCIAVPTAPSEAFPLTEQMTDPRMLYRSDIFTIPPSLGGFPSISVPMGLSKNKLPLGIQFTTNYLREDMALNFAYKIEKEIGVFSLNKMI